MAAVSTAARVRTSPYESVAVCTLPRVKQASAQEPGIGKRTPDKLRWQVGQVGLVGLVGRVGHFPSVLLSHPATLHYAATSKPPKSVSLAAAAKRHAQAVTIKESNTTSHYGFFAGLAQPERSWINIQLPTSLLDWKLLFSSVPG